MRIVAVSLISLFAFSSQAFTSVDCRKHRVSEAQHVTVEATGVKGVIVYTMSNTLINLDTDTVESKISTPAISTANSKSVVYSGRNYTLEIAYASMVKVSDNYNGDVVYRATGEFTEMHSNGNVESMTMNCSVLDTI